MKPWEELGIHHDSGNGVITAHPSYVSCPKCDAAKEKKLKIDSPLLSDTLKAIQEGLAKLAAELPPLVSGDTKVAINFTYQTPPMPTMSYAQMLGMLHVGGEQKSQVHQVIPQSYGNSLTLLRKAIPALGECDLVEEHGGGWPPDTYDPDRGGNIRYRLRADCPAQECNWIDRPVLDVVMHLNDTHFWPRSADDGDVLRQARINRWMEVIRHAENELMGHRHQPPACTPPREYLQSLTDRSSHAKRQIDRLYADARLGCNIADWLDEYAVRTGADLSFRSPAGP